MRIRPATLSDIPAMKEIFEIGRQKQIETGNPNQWLPGYPSIEQLTADINSGTSYVCFNDVEEMVGTFYLLMGEDPTYKVIEEGQWLNDLPYVTIHRIVSKYDKQGIGQQCIQWVMNHYPNIKIDTHELNRPMRQLLTKLGFQYCGIIYLPDGRTRLAYQYYQEDRMTI